MTKYVSLDNGRTWLDAAETIEAITEQPYMWQMLVNIMDDDVREAVHRDLAPCTELEFLAEYLKRAEDDLVIG
jgi:hypothetical protein